MKASVFNLGCKVNQYECDCIVTALQSWGIEVTERLEKADIFIVNTCAVTREAEKKSRQILSRIKRISPESQIFVTGCASQKNPEFYKRKKIEIIHGVKNKKYFLSTIYKTIFKNKLNLEESTSAYEELNYFPAITRARCYIKIQDGCNNGCLYCTISILRGNSRSRELISVKKELDYYSKKIYEIIITGINLSQYKTEKGEDIKDIIELVNYYDFRFRLGSLYVDIIAEDLLMLLKKSEHFCPHFHLSLQSLSTPVLTSMGRTYSKDDIIKSVKIIRKYFPSASIFADIIIGYPSESETNFKETIEVLKFLKLSGLHLFKFSKREDTPAFLLEELDSHLVSQRLDVAKNLDNYLRKEYMMSMINVVQRVIIEGQHKNGMKFGHSEYYLKIYVNTNKEIVDVKPIKLFLDGIIATEI